jgi:cadmium resistance protein CadD (predicted permease)
MSGGVLVLVAGAAFLSTSLDSMVFMVPALAVYRRPAIRLLGGYLVAMTVIIALSWALGTAGEAVLPVDPGILGVIPLGMGIVLLVRRATRRHEAVLESSSLGPGGLLVMTFSLSADNFGVFIPLFADTADVADRLVAATLLLSAVVWSGLALALSQRRVIRSAVRKWGEVLVPFLLIAVGAYILSNTGLDVG